MAELLTHIVQRGFEDDGVQRLSGEVVNAMYWRNTESMVNLRYLAPLPDGLEPVVDSEGRYWDSLMSLKRHKRPELGVEAEQEEEAAPKEPVEEGAQPKHIAGGLWEMPIGPRFRGKKAAALAEHERRVQEQQEQEEAVAVG